MCSAKHSQHEGCGGTSLLVCLPKARLWKFVLVCYTNIQISISTQKCTLIWDLCHLLKWVSEWVIVCQSCPTLRPPRDWSPPGPSVHGILQARRLEWVAISFFKIYGLNRFCILLRALLAFLVAQTVKRLSACKVGDPGSIHICTHTLLQCSPKKYSYSPQKVHH